MKKIIGLILAMACVVVLAGCVQKGNNGDLVVEYEAITKGEQSQLAVNEIDTIQVVLISGKPTYETVNKIITDENEISAFVNAFETATINKDIQIDVSNSIKSYYRLYADEELVKQYAFSENNINAMWTGQEFEFIEYSDETPYELYQNSKSPEIITIDVDGKETVIVYYTDKRYVKSELPEETIEWLEWFNNLDKDEQLTISFVPDFGDAKPLGDNYITDTQDVETNS